MSQASAAFSAAPFEHSAASSARHTLHKTVLVGAVSLLGLVRSFWHWFVNSLVVLHTECNILTGVKVSCPPLSFAIGQITMFSPFFQDFSTD
jgi:hypothetical protein